MDAQSLFRKAALDKLGASERLDIPMRIIPSSAWLALATIAALLVAVIVWSVIGELPERVDGQGILIRGGELRNIVASGTGRLSRVTVRLDDVVRVGQVVAQIEQPDLTDRVRLARRRYEDAATERRTADAADAETIQGHLATIDSLRDEIVRTDEILRRQTQTAESLERLLRAGGITQSRIEQARQAMDQSQSRIDGLHSEIRRLNAQIRSDKERARARQQQVGIAHQALANEERRLITVSKVKAEVEGRVVELKRRSGDSVDEGEPLVTLEPSSAGLQSVVFVPSGAGKRIEQGMAVRVYPRNVKREEHGFLKGTVVALGHFPVTPETVVTVTGNSQLAHEFLSDGSKIEIRIALERDPHVASGYAWSSGAGPSFPISGGTPVAVSIVVARHRPISKVWPAIKRAGGIL